MHLPSGIKSVEELEMACSKGTSQAFPKRRGRFETEDIPQIIDFSNKRQSVWKIDYEKSN